MNTDAVQGMLIGVLLVALIYMQVSMGVYLVRRNRERARIARLRAEQARLQSEWQVRVQKRRQHNSECWQRLQTKLQEDQAESSPTDPLPPASSHLEALIANVEMAAQKRQRAFAKHVEEVADEAGRKHWAEEWKGGLE